MSPPSGNTAAIDAAPPHRSLPAARLPGAVPADRTFFAPRPPQPITTFLAGIVEPLLAIAALLGITLQLEGDIDRPTSVLAMLTLLLGFPGKNRIGHAQLVMGWDILSSWCSMLAILALCGFATRSWHFFNPDVLVAWAVMAPLLQWLFALAASDIYKRWSRRSSVQRRALVVGAGTLGVQVADMLKRRQDIGMQFIGFAEDRRDRISAEAQQQVVGALADLPQLIAQHNVKDVYITLPLSSQPRIMRLMAGLHDSAASIFFVPDVFGVSVVQGHMRNLDGVPIVSLLESPFIGVNGLAKRISDVVLASAILVLISPIMLAVALGVKLSSPGPIIFKQRRHGLDGREIVVYKFRSMRTQDNGPVVKQATRNDPRITPFGAFIRRTSLDELPQFINVLQGRMSIVGPRPHAVAHNEQYRHIIRAYMVRHKVKPGITGWAQVNGCRGETETVDKMAQRVDYDIEYLRNWSLALDLKIIARTAGLTWFDRQAY